MREFKTILNQYVKCVKFRRSLKIRMYKFRVDRYIETKARVMYILAVVVIWRLCVCVCVCVLYF